MLWFANLNLFKKILIISIMMMMSALAWGSFNSYMAYTIKLNDLRDRTRLLAETAHTMVTGLQKEVTAGRMSEQDAKKMAITVLRNSRYEDGKQYFWINTMDGQAVMHPLFPEMETQDLSKTKKAVYDLFLNFAKVVKENPKGAEYNYGWPKPGEDKEVLHSKTSYVVAVPEWGWVVGTGVYLADLSHERNLLFLFEFGFVACFAVILATGTYFSVRLLSRPLQQLSKNMGELAAGNLAVEVPHSHRHDEVGMIAKAFDVFKRNAVEKLNLEKQQIELNKQAELDKKKSMQDLADNFESRTSGVIDALSSSAEQLNVSAREMKDVSEENVLTSRGVAKSINEANQNVQTVASATEELTVSSQEIARQISGVAEKSGRSSSAAEQTNKGILRLNDLADSIGDVVSAIKGIAEQTNLLALNATIEAARAGDAGKGFAVVADEVKKLATETANKTTEIDERVLQIQHAIRETVDSVQSILNDVKDIDHATSTVASAVEEQYAATSEIGRNISQASSGTQEVAVGITDVLEKSESTGKSADVVLTAAVDLAKISNDLQKEVSLFLQGIRG